MLWLCCASIAIILSIAFCGATTVVYPDDCGVTHNNTIPLCDTEPLLIQSIRNGKLFRAGCGNDSFEIVHVWGSPYEQGVAHGTLQADAVKAVPDLMTAFLEAMIQENVPSWVPSWAVDLIAKYGAPFLLDLTFEWTKPFTPQRYLDEMQGIADGAGMDVKKIIQYNMFPETTKAACSIVGATGPSTTNGKIAHLRALDFSPNCPIKDFPQITVYHPSPGSVLPAVANFGWAGMVGSLTGISDRVVGIGEKVWLNKNAAADDGVRGEPWMFVLRDVLMQPDMDAALRTLRDANRTCSIHVGVGDSVSNTFRGLTIAKHAFQVFNDSSLNYPEHPILPGIVYWDKHSQPTKSYCLPTLLRQYYGKLDAETLALKVAAAGATGDFHSITFDYENLVAFVANARKTYVTEGALPAYNRQYTRVDVKKLFAETL